MPQTFSTPAGSPVVGFSTQKRTFPSDTSFGSERKKFATTIITYSGQKVIFNE